MKLRYSEAFYSVQGEWEAQQRRLQEDLDKSS